MSNDNNTTKNRKTNNTRTGYFITIELMTPRGVKDKCFTTVKDWEAVQSFISRIRSEFTILNLSVSKMGVKQ